MSAAFDLHTLARISAERIVGSLAEGVALTILAGLLLRFLRRQNAGTRFAVWFAVLAAIGMVAVFGGVWTHSASPVVAAQGVARAAITLPESWALYIFVGWALIAAAGLVRIGIGLWQLRRVRRSCVAVDLTQLDPELHDTLRLCRALAARRAASRAFALCTSEVVQAPAAIGFLKPVIVLPSWLFDELPAAELRQVILHELAHLRRWDDWTNLAEKVLQALLFFHPAVWWLEQKIALEREMACDDAVLAQTANPHAYARCLVRLAEKSLVRRGLALAQAAVSRLRHTSMRVAEILDGDAPRTTHVWKPAVSLVAVLACAGFILLGRAPRLISFQAGSPAVAAPAPAQKIEPVAVTRPNTSKVAAHRLPARPPRQLPNNKVEVARAGAPAVTPAETHRQPAAPPATFVVFVESRSYAADGTLQWQLAVWRFTIPQNTNPAAKEVTRKSI